MPRPSQQRQKSRMKSRSGSESSRTEIGTAVLSEEQVERLGAVLQETFTISGRGNFPSLRVSLRVLIGEVRARLVERGLVPGETKINGGAASSILASAADLPYSDVDLIYHIALPDDQAFEEVKDAVFDALSTFLPAGAARDKIPRSALKDAYIQKMVKVADIDRWSLFALNNHGGKSIELKFMDTMRRQFEFSVDSFQITLDPLLDAFDEMESRMGSLSLSSGLGSTVTEGESASEEPAEAVETETTAGSWSTPSRSHSSLSASSVLSTGLVVVPAESVFGDFRGALRHLNERLIDTARPEEIRGGGLLKYCHLLVRGYRAAQPWKCKQLERYMCSRFFIDFPDLGAQELKLCAYLDSHFSGGDGARYEYLLLLYRVVSESTICLMSHERRQTLAMIDRLAYNLSLSLYYAASCESGSCTHTPRQTLLYLPRNAHYWVPVV